MTNTIDDSITATAGDQAAWVKELEDDARNWDVLYAGATSEMLRIHVQYEQAVARRAGIEQKQAQAHADVEAATKRLAHIVERDPDIEVAGCSECGHLHWVPAFKVYITCPLDLCGCTTADFNGVRE